jgi:hypothetical protein
MPRCYTGASTEVASVSDALALDFAVLRLKLQRKLGAEVRLGLTWSVPVWHADSDEPAEPKPPHVGAL